MSETTSFTQKQQQAHELRSVERLQDELRTARLLIADHKQREITLTEEIQRIDRSAKEAISAIKEEAVTKAAEVVEKVLAEDFAALCKQLGIEPQGAPELQTSLRIAETMKLLGEFKVRLDWLIAHGAYVSRSRDGEVCNVWFSQDPDDDGNGAVPAEGYPQKCYGDGYAAIDGARKAKA